MASYIILANFTDQGARAIKETVQRAEAAQKRGAEHGVNVKSLHWTLGQYDIVMEVDAKDEASLAAFGLSVASLGNVRMQTLRAFTADEMKANIAKMR